jgi:hypothetical protein
MACSMTTHTISSPAAGGSVVVYCPVPGGTGILSYTSGSANATCRAIGVRAQINGGSWKSGSTNTTSPTGGPPFMIGWSVGDVPNVTCSGNNQLVVEIQLSDGTWHRKTSNFTASCGSMPVPRNITTADPIYMTVQLDPPWDLSGLQVGKLIDINTITLRRSYSDEVALPLVEEDDEPQAEVVWRSVAPDAGLWRLTMTGPRRAEIELVAAFTINGQTVTLEQQWGCADFDPRHGGLFAPLANVFIPQYLVVSDEPPQAAMMAMASSQRKTTAKKSGGKVKRGAKKAPKAKPKGRGKAKARRKAKKGRGRGR